MNDTRPNILFIMADQWRYDYTGYMGADHVNTPHLDKLAASGMVFTHCCTNAPVCAPARISLASGILPYHLGALNNHAFLPLNYPTYYQQLRNHGYRVGCVGKLDLAKPDSYNGLHGDRPVCYAWGFTDPEECEGKMHAGRGNPPLGPYTRWLQERGLLEQFCDDYRKRGEIGWKGRGAWDSVLPTDAFEDVYIGRRAAEWIDQVDSDFPWHYFVSFVGPHNPFDPPTEYADKYRHADMPDPIPISADGKPPRIRKRQNASAEDNTPEMIRHARRQYCAAIECIDDMIGEMLAALDRRGLRENTYIIFSSDHGEMLGDHGLWTKSVFYEPSLRVPLLMSGPGITAGTTNSGLVELSDLNPTICELAGVPAIQDIDAQSFARVLRGEKDKARESIVSYHHDAMCVRTERHKYIEGFEGSRELFDLEEDPRELNNLADGKREIELDLAPEPHRRLQQRKWMR